MRDREITAEVVGFIRTVPSFPAFVVPVFGLPGVSGVWTQVVEDERVCDFSPLFEGSEFIAAFSQAYTRIGASEVFGFSFGETEVFFEKEVKMAQYLLENKSRLSKYPHVLAEAADFYLKFFLAKKFGSEFSGLLDDVVAQNARATRADIMGIPHSADGAGRIDVFTINRLSQSDLIRLHKLSRKIGNVNVFELADLIKWGEGIPSENRFRWTRRAIQDRFELTSGVAIIGTPETEKERDYLKLLLETAFKLGLIAKQASSARSLIQWAHSLPHGGVSDKEYVAELFGLPGATKSGNSRLSLEKNPHRKF